MKSFHVTCPYTSLLVCHCSLQTAKPLPSIQKKKSIQSTKSKSLLSQSLLQQLILQTSSTPTPTSTHPISPSFLRSIYWHSNYAKLPPVSSSKSTQQLLSTYFRNCDQQREQNLSQLCLKKSQALQALDKANTQLQRAQQKAFTNTQDHTATRLAVDLVNQQFDQHDLTNHLISHQQQDDQLLHISSQHQQLSDTDDEDEEEEEEEDDDDDDDNDPDAIISARGRVSRTSRSNTNRRRRRPATSTTTRRRRRRRI